MRSYNHVQSTPSDTWTITHNLGTVSTTSDVNVWIGGSLTKILPENVVHTSDNVLTITFTSARTGVARILGN